jgi:hypothetical protein
VRDTLRYLVVVSSEVSHGGLPLIQSLHKLIVIVFSRSWARPGQLVKKEGYQLESPYITCAMSALPRYIIFITHPGLIVVTFVIRMWPNHCVDFRLP